MGDIIISVRKLVDAEESFFGWPKRSRRQQGRGRGIGGGGRSYQAGDDYKRLLKGWSEEEEAIRIPGEREGY